MPVANHNPIVGTPTEQQLHNFFIKVGYDDISGCHPWLAAKGFHPDYPGDLTQAQGRWNFNGRTVTAYRMAMFIELGFVDPGPTVDHLCHNRICVNPLHLRCMPLIENNRARRCVLSDYCRRGHLRTEESIGIRPETGNRFCRVCNRIRDKERYTDKYAKEKLKNTHTSAPVAGKLNEDKVMDILKLHYKDGVAGRELARRFQVSQPMIRFILMGSSWKSVHDRFVAENPHSFDWNTLELYKK